MRITFKVSISRSDGFSARIGETRDVDDELAQELMTNEQAVPADAIKLPRPPSAILDTEPQAATIETEPALVIEQRKRNAGRSKP